MPDNPALKELFNAEVVTAMAAGLAQVHPAFDQASFISAATTGLEQLELKQRARHIAAAVAAHLPADFPTTARLIREAATASEQRAPLVRPIACWALNELVQEHGLAHLEQAMATLQVLTVQMSSEFAIRPFLDRYPDEVMAWLERWAADPIPEVRRLVSEGSRPRLPWAPRLQRFNRDDPFIMLPLLEQLRDDPAETVRRSVANHLNDLCKDHPDRVVEILAGWADDAAPARQRLIRHALRTLIKKGHAGALAMLGYTEATVEATLQVSPAVVELGGAIEIVACISSTAQERQELVIDYAVHHQRANGRLTSKVFKWTTRGLGAGEQLELRRRHQLVPISTRRYYPGEHRVELLVNGASCGLVLFELRCR